MDLRPFVRPLPTVEPYKANAVGWDLGRTDAPTWAATASDYLVETASVHALLRVACLPLVELRHMGWSLVDLSANGPEWLPRAAVALALGRIVLDATVYSEQALVWEGADADRRQAAQLGEAVIERFFYR